MLPSKKCVHFRGSETVKALVQAACEPYSAEHLDRSLVIVGGGTERGYKAVLDGTTHFGMVASDMGPEMEGWAKRSSAILASTVVGFDGVIAYVHQHNPVESLTIENLHDIYTGTITNWSDVGGPDAPIVPLSQYPSTGSYGVWKKLVLGESGSFATKVKTLDGSALLQEVNALPNTIGFGSSVLERGLAKPLQIGGVAVSVDNIKSGAYPLKRPLMLVADQATDPVAKAFLTWFLDPAKGQKMLQRLGVIPVN